MDWGRFGYAAFMVLGTVTAGIAYRRYGGGTTSLTNEQRWGIAVGGIIGATFAAKLPFAFGISADGGWLGLWTSDGKTVLWGLVGGYAGVEVAKWSLYVRERTGDRFVIPVALAIGIGRFGCLCNGCCYGIPTNGMWGIRSDESGNAAILRHPAPLYESIFHLSFAAIAFYGIGQGWIKQQWMLIYLITYCAFRFVSEYWREEPIAIAGLTFYQVSAAVFAIAFSVLLIWRRSNP
ncbi:prolipoprotein diacylglyceryl transferase [Rhodopirellula sp. MGV]|uniref:prolipoprotein diacylglyceryl transferase n=1 Tax=Rhodopirellula sp. MGV TaxID=2023130 RepID=UPI000B96901C|nr:prolipoprotein diacylglyceryl transferase family protein [Rhodopirellula sp. MGV]OYP37033.1 hypothetical protein CGZ80_06685 [Rhodopirellula sp. MGV]PNY36205.1 diacylglyceryl transferase [Rhodopirellula baltica]